jgi:hypothetical protein
MTKDLYYANVYVEGIDYFEQKLEERKDKIKIVEKSESPRIAEDGLRYITYILEAEEGLIDPEFKLR